jgi:hypothetical protein
MAVKHTKIVDVGSFVKAWIRIRIVFMAVKHTKIVDVGSFVKARIRIRYQMSVSRSKQKGLDLAVTHVCFIAHRGASASSTVSQNPVIIDTYQKDPKT